jgi:hypothetical protein
MVKLTPYTTRRLLAEDFFGVGDGLRLGDGLVDGRDGDGLGETGSIDGRAVASSSGEAGAFHCAPVACVAVVAQPVSASTTMAIGAISLFTAAV